MKNQLGKCYLARVELQISKFKDRESTIGVGKKMKFDTCCYTKKEANSLGNNGMHNATKL